MGKSLDDQLNEIKKIKMDCLGALLEIISVQSKDITSIIQLCHSSIKTVANIKDISFFIKIEEDRIEIKNLIVEILSRIEESESVIRFFKNYYLEENNQTRAKACDIIANKLFSSSLENDQDNLNENMILACAYFILSVYWGEKNNISAVKNCLEQIVFNSVQSRNLNEILAHPNFIENIWDSLLNKIDNITGSFDENIQTLLSAENMMNNAEIFCEYICDKDKRFVLSTELWRLNSKYWQNEFSKLKKLQYSNLMLFKSPKYQPSNKFGSAFGLQMFKGINMH